MQNGCFPSIDQTGVKNRCKTVTYVWQRGGFFWMEWQWREDVWVSVHSISASVFQNGQKMGKIFIVNTFLTLLFSNSDNNIHFPTKQQNIHITSIMINYKYIFNKKFCLTFIPAIVTFTQTDWSLRAHPVPLPLQNWMKLENKRICLKRMRKSQWTAAKIVFPDKNNLTFPLDYVFVISENRICL